MLSFFVEAIRFDEFDEVRLDAVVFYTTRYYDNGVDIFNWEIGLPFSPTGKS
jgi:hypothetical protein